MIRKNAVARGVPFDPTGSLLVSTNVNAAILEVLSAGFNNSKAFLLANYGGNANAGRYLEVFPGVSSDEAPILVNSPYKGITIVTRTTAVNATCTVEIRDIKNIASPITLYTVTFSAVKQVVNLGSTGSPLFTSASDAQLAFYVASGSIAKPHLYIIGQGG